MTDSRAKGRLGESRAATMLHERGYSTYDTSSGKTQADLLAIDEHGNAWAVEVKHRLVWAWKAFYAQARANAGKARWMLMLHIPQTSSWLVLRQNERPVVWHERS